MGMAVNDRNTELEIRLSLMEDLVEELNRTVFRQQQELVLLQAQLRHLYRQMKADAEAQATAESAAPPSLREDVPPHY